MMMLATALLALFLSTVDVYATAVLVQRTDSELIVAADSRELAAGKFSDNRCKLLQLDSNTFFVFSGQVISHAPLLRTLADANQSDRNFDSMVEAWMSIMRQLYRYGLEEFTKNIKDNVISHGVFGHSDKNELLLYHIEFYYVGDQVYARRRAINDPSINGFGDTEPVELVATFLTNTTETNPAQTLKASIEFAISRMPNGTVGGPIDVLKLAKGSTIQWITEPRDCATVTRVKTVSP